MASRSSILELAPVSAEEPDASLAWVVEPHVHAAMQAARRIMGATSVDLLRVDRRSGQVLAASLAGAATLVAADVRDAVSARGDRVLGGRFPRWLDGPGVGEATLIGRVAEQASRSFFLVFRLQDAGKARDRATALLPDLATLIQLYADTGERLDAVREARDAATAALDQGECGVVAVRADQSVVLANAAARAMLATEDGLHVRRGTVRPTALADAIRFGEALQRVIDPPLGEGAGRPKAIAMLLTRTGTGPAPIIVVAPAPPARQADGVAAIITIHQPAPGAARGLDALCRLHGFTKVEGRLVAHLMAERTLTEAAGEMHVKVETARAYLKQVFAKTGLHRQTDLVAMMARYARALRGDFEFLAA